MTFPSMLNRKFCKMSVLNRCCR